MDRRGFLGASAALGLGPSAAFAAASDPYAAIFDAVLRRSPESATTAGLDRGARAALKHRLDDRSRPGRLNYYEAIIEAAPRLRAVGATGPRDAIFRETVLWLADAMRPFRAFGYGGVDGNFYPIPYVVTQVSGAYQFIPDFLDTQHTIETREDAEAYLDRLGALPAALDQETARIESDAAQGVTPPRIIVERTLSQLRTFQSGQRGPGATLVTSLARRAASKGLAGDWAARAQTIVDGPVAAAGARQIAALEAVLPAARTVVGAGSLPQGAAYYSACLHFHTTTALTPEAAHRLGLEQVAVLKGQVKAILDKQGHGAATLGQAFKALATDPRYLFPNDDAGRAALLDYIRGLETAMYGRLPQAFSRLPRTPLEVRRVPPANELGSPGAYSQSGAMDGSRPGAIYFNLRDTANWPRWAIATTAYHEGVPGHHFQGSIANETPDLPALFKTIQFTAHGEGWALYAEQLAGELGAYDNDPLGRLGMLRDSLFRACRIVVDTGMHARGWTREQSIAFLIENAGTTPDDARRETERYISWPGQACAYKIGQLEILRLRASAKAQLGSRFDLKGFHEAVLQYGALPLEVLAKAVDLWVRDAGGAPRPAKA